MAKIELNAKEFERLQNAIKAYSGNVEESINEVLHNYGGETMEASIKRLIPVSGKSWKGKKGAAAKSNSLRNVNENLAVTTTTQKAYQYLYFPDDGTNTRRHAGNQQFFRRGAEAVQDAIVDRCVAKLINNFEKGE